jgi:hypothetical protein
MEAEEIHHETMTGADTADWEDLVCATVHRKVYKSVWLLQLLVVMSCNSLINTIANLDPLYSH